MDKKKDNSFPFIPDMDCDGDHDFMDFLIFQDQMDYLDKIEKEKKEEQERKSRMPVKNYSWRENTEDGSDYDIFPEDYETEEEYLEVLEDARYYAEEYYEDEDENEDEDEDEDEDTFDDAEDFEIIKEPSVSITDENLILIFDAHYNNETQSLLWEHYNLLKDELKTNVNSVKVRNRLIELLIGRCLRFSLGGMVSALNKETEKYSVLMGIKNKCQNELIELLQYYVNRSYGTTAQKDRMQFLSLFLQAEVFITMGDLVKTVQTYYEILSLPFVKKSIDEMNSEMYYAEVFSKNDLEIILRVLHNISVVYNMLDLDYKSKELYSKYNKLVKIFYNFTNKIIESVPQCANDLRKKCDILCGFEDNNIIYIPFHPRGYLLDRDKSWLDIDFEYAHELFSDDIDNEITWEYNNGAFSILEYDDEYSHFDEDDVDIEKQKRKIEALY